MRLLSSMQSHVQTRMTVWGRVQVSAKGVTATVGSSNASEENALQFSALRNFASTELQKNQTGPRGSRYLAMQESDAKIHDGYDNGYGL